MDKTHKPIHFYKACYRNEDHLIVIDEDDETKITSSVIGRLNIDGVDCYETRNSIYRPLLCLM